MPRPTRNITGLRQTLRLARFQTHHFLFFDPYGKPKEEALRGYSDEHDDDDDDAAKDPSFQLQPCCTVALDGASFVVSPAHESAGSTA